MRLLFTCTAIIFSAVTAASAQDISEVKLAALSDELPYEETQERNAEYEFSIGGLRIAEVSLGAMFGIDSYEAKSNIITRGILDLILRGRAASEVQGGFNAFGRLSPQAFFSDYSSRGGDQTMKISYHGPKPQRVEYNPPTPPEPFAAEIDDQIGTLDPLTAGILALMPSKDSQLCNRTIPVFDGTRRFDVIFLPPDPERSNRKAPKPRAGRALTRCLGIYERIDGFEKDTIEKGRYFPFDIWFEETPSGEYRALKLAGKTTLGYAIGKLASE